MAYKNFENLVTHSLEQDDTRICVSKKLIGVIFHALCSHRSELAIRKPESNDPVYKVIGRMKGGLDQADGWSGLKGLPSFDDKVNLKLKTRLFVQSVLEASNQQQQVDGQLSQYVRCCKC